MGKKGCWQIWRLPVVAFELSPVFTMITMRKVSIPRKLFEPCKQTALPFKSRGKTCASALKDFEDFVQQKQVDIIKAGIFDFSLQVWNFSFCHTLPCLWYHVPAWHLLFRKPLSNYCRILDKLPQHWAVKVPEISFFYFWDRRTCSFVFEVYCSARKFLSKLLSGAPCIGVQSKFCFYRKQKPWMGERKCSWSIDGSEILPIKMPALVLLQCLKEVNCWKRWTLFLRFNQHQPQHLSSDNLKKHYWHAMHANWSSQLWVAQSWEAARSICSRSNSSVTLMPLSCLPIIIKIVY